MAESMAGLKRSHRCTELGTANIGEKVTVWAGFRLCQNAEVIRADLNRTCL